MKKFPVLFVLIFLAMPAFCANAEQKTNMLYDINIKWFENFNDEILMKYLYEALENNKDVTIARKNILKYRQDKNIELSKEFPYIGVGANYLLLKVPQLAIPDNDIQTNSFALPFLTVWEIDYLGKKHDSVKKARLDMENSLFDWKSSRLIVSVDLASAYFNVSNLNKQISLQQKIYNLSEEIFKRKKKMFEFGTISTSELNNSYDLVLSAKNDLNVLEKQKEAFLTQIAYLRGISPYNINDIDISEFDKINFTGTYPVSFKGDVILNRPDILKLDCEIKKAKLDITIAKKDFLPSINVFGILTFSTILQSFNWNTALAALSVGATQTIFDGGKKIFNLKKQKIKYDIALENYLKTDISALKEVNDTLYSLKKDLETYKNNKERLEIARSNFVNVFKSYDKGVKSYVDYMAENSSYIRKESELQNSKNQNFINLLSVYKATGGAL